jgi:hypothetical protein
MKSKLQDKCFLILFFLALYGFSIGLFDNYRELWMSANGLDTSSISHVISISYIVTVLILFFFTIKVSLNKLKSGICISLAIKLICEAILICLNNGTNLFLIKFFMFFDVAFSQLIISSIYPLIMNLEKSDILYAKKSFVESTFNKLGFLVAAIILGKVIFNRVIDYNFCLLMSVIFTFLAFLVLMSVSLDVKKREVFNVRNTIKYFQNNKIYYVFLMTNLLTNMIWSSILGMPMLTLTKNLNFSSFNASVMILSLGIMSNFLAMFIIKCFKFKNDYINLFIKYGTRIILYIIVFLTKSEFIYLITIVYLLLTYSTHDFIFNSFFINKIDEAYSLLLTTLVYCSSILGNAFGILLCGMVFDLNVRYLVLPALVISIIHYLVSSFLVSKKKKMLVLE